MPEPPRRSLTRQVRLARVWLPLAIVGVVLAWQLLVVPRGDASFAFWAQLLFYGILGPAATIATLSWIAGEVKRREEAQHELTRLYHELKSSHELLGAIQKVTEQFASAADLEAALDAATHGITAVTGAQGVAVFVGSSEVGVARSHNLAGTLVAAAEARDAALRVGGTVAERVATGTHEYHALASRLVWAGNFEGSVHAFFRQPPDARQREAFGILASEFAAAAEATRGRMRDLLTLIEVDRSIRAEGNLERLLEMLLSHMMRRAGATVGGVYLADDAGGVQLQAVHGRRRSGAPGGGSDPFAEVVARGGVPRIEAHLGDALRRGDRLLEGAASAIGLPLRTDDELLGVVVLAHQDADRFDAGSLAFLGLLAGQVSLAVRNARAYLQSEELAIAEERARIAREIHDGVAQMLAVSALKLDLVARLVGRDNDKAQQELANAKATIREMIKEVRRSIFALRPIDLERHGFIETIRRYLDDFGQQNDLHVELHVGDLPDLDLKSEAVLFRIFQEAMHNVAKHAHASNVRVALGTRADRQTFVEIEDDGCGFDPDRVADRVTSAGGLGLRQMRERVEGRGGSFEITSATGAGTRIRASLPG